MPHKRHPTLKRPITVAQLKRELAWVWARARFERWMTYEIFFPPRLTKTHRRNSRRYAQCIPGTRTIFEFAEQVLWLPREHRLGLIAHEIGHVIDPGSEADADAAAYECLGILVGYDQRWPTHAGRRGLQYAARIL